MRRPADIPYLLLTLASLLWSGNVIASRLAIGDVSPMALTAFRWIGVCVILFFTVRRQFVADWPALRPRLGYLAWMGTLGFTGFNAAFYIAAYHTSAINIGIIQGAIPILVFIIAYFVRGTAVTPLQLVGVFLTLFGVALIAAHGDLATIASLEFNIGDLLMLLASLFYAIYTVGLARKPATRGFSFFAALAGFALLSSLPLLAIEVWRGDFFWPTWQGWLIIAYVTVLPSLLAQVFFIRGVELIGPGRAGVSINMIPVFAAILAVLLLGEPFMLYHALALALVLGGIVLAERKRKTGGGAAAPGP
jgi:drug/metabolite transporter (DMT)-like permease